MINKFQKVGLHILNEKIIKDEEIKKFKFLKTNAIIPQSNERIERAILINFNLQTKNFKFKLSEKELSPENRDYFFAHSKKGSGFKIYLNTNSILTLISDTINDSLKNLDKLSKGKTKAWYKKYIDTDYYSLIKQLCDEFFIENPNKKNKFILNPHKICSSQKNILNHVKEKAKNKKEEVVYKDWFRYFLNKKYFNSNSKSTRYFPNIAQILINGKNILEYKNSKFKETYINLVYYNFIKKHFVSDGLQDKKCHICGEKKEVIKKGSPLPMNFYGTTNNLYFNNLKNTKTYQSFAICEQCTRNTFAGMKYSENNFRDYLFRNNCVLIPNLQHKEYFEPDNYRRIFNVLKTKTDKYKNEINRLNAILRKTNKTNLSFDLMLYFAEQNSFDILKLIQNIETNKLIPKLTEFDKMTELYRLDHFDKSITLNTYLFYLFSKYQNNKIVYENKKIINFISIFFSQKKYKYLNLINEFIITVKNHILNEKYNSLAALKMNLFLKIVSNLNKIKGVKTMAESKMVSEIFNDDYQQFFQTHAEVYENAPYKQGLFLLGTIIAKIKKAQKTKTSTFLKKMNFSGMSTRRLQTFINKVKEYTIIYEKEIYHEGGIWGNIMDRLQGIEKSNLQPAEVVFYILSGISFSDYLSKKNYHEKKEKNLEKEMEENNE